ncbi:MAG: sodium/solute symporter, partial [Saprospiraceae bacterium]|nr:sodium/solute symporter [Saprospiraceae bacterium]
MGGCDADRTYDEVLCLTWDSLTRQIRFESFPALPTACVYGSATLIGDMIYLAGGTNGLDLSTAMTNFWRLDLSAYGNESFRWEVLPPWPGPERAFNLTLAQHNGYTDCVYVISGRKDAEGAEWDMLRDVYEFNPQNYLAGKKSWRRRTDIPQSRMAGTGIPIGQSHLFVLSGADGSLYQQSEELQEQHPGFPKNVWGYHTITDTWFEAGEMPTNHVTTHAFSLWDHWYIVSGEIKPRTRSPGIWKISPVRTATSFGHLDLAVIVIYLLILVGIGVLFSYRNKTTDDFFRGGQRIPWWAAGCSIFATMLSSITFMSVPAKTYATDWIYFLINLMIVALAPFIIYFVLPFFRRIDATSAYEYLELRFNLPTRLFGSMSYILFQLGRMAIVMYLPSLALASVTPISLEASILIMGLLSIIYCALGGIEAVIWTDTLQTFVLLGGALFSLILIIFSPEVGLSGFYHTALADDKLQMIDWGWDVSSAVLWVVLLGGVGQTLVPYTSDQGVIQRYMSVGTKSEASKSIWMNAGLSFVATLLFFSLGTALYIFYKTHPTNLDPTYQTDAIFPLFIAQQLPMGIAGLVIAGIFAAAQSTISTSMNSIATAGITDFVRRFQLVHTENAYLNLARIFTILAGILGTGCAWIIAYADIKSLWDTFIGILGLFGGALCGLFLLGIFTTRASGNGALVGAISGAAVLWWVQRNTDISFLLYAAIGVLTTVAIGWIIGPLWRVDSQKLDQLTIHTVEKNK